MHNEFKFKLGGRTYVIYTDDGCVYGIKRPDGTFIDVFSSDDIPQELRDNPRFCRMIAREREDVRSARAYGDEYGR